MEGIAVLLLLMCIIALGVQGESLEDREASCPRDKRFQLKCRKCFEVLDADYEKTLGPYSGSVAQKTCPSCNVQFPNKVLSSTLECRGNTKATLYRWFGPRCNCPDAGHCADYLHKDYKYTKGTLFGSVAVKKCNRTCAVGYVSLKKRTCKKKTKLWSNQNPSCKCHPVRCPDTLGDEYSKTKGDFVGSVATSLCNKACDSGSTSLIRRKCRINPSKTIMYWTNKDNVCRCHTGGAGSGDDQTSAGGGMSDDESSGRFGSGHASFDTGSVSPGNYYDSGGSYYGFDGLVADYNNAVDAAGDVEAGFHDVEAGAGDAKAAAGDALHQYDYYIETAGTYLDPSGWF